MSKGRNDNYMETENRQVEKNKKSGNKIKVILVLLVAVIFAIYTYGSYRAEYLEISEIGEQYIKIFVKNIKTASVRTERMPMTTG